jgi:cyclopropane-fatty-acyl-phospholipid synthase
MVTSLGPRRADQGTTTMQLAEVLDTLVQGTVPFRFSAYDGSTTGPAEAPIGLHLASSRGAAYLASAPGSLGMARAYVSGDLQATGVHPGDPYPLLRQLTEDLHWRVPDARMIARIARSLGVSRLVPPPPPPQEAMPDWRRALEGLRHSRRRDAEAIHHHYDVSNTFYEYLLGPSMTYTCACYPAETSMLEEAQAAKYELVLRKLGLHAGQRLLDVGCGWGGMVLHAARQGVRALGVTLSREQASWAQEAIKREGLDHLGEVRHADYRDVVERGFDGVSSIGLTEHIGVGNYPDYFRFLRDRLRPGGRLLNHCITRPENQHAPRVRNGFIDRYVFPDGELTGSGRIISVIQDVGGFEVRHEENLREHYARTCAAWCANLVEHWDACVAEAGEATAKVWGLYLAGSRLGFERNQIQLHQVLAVKLHADGGADFPLRPDWGSV